MSNIINRLNAFGSDDPLEMDCLCRDAADRIEALEAEIDQLQAKLHCVCGSPVGHSTDEGHAPVSSFDYALDGTNKRIETLEAALWARHLTTTSHRYRSRRPRTGAGQMSEREEIIELIRNEYDPAPAHYKMSDDWDDGAGRIADAVLADKALALRQAADRIEALEAALRDVRNVLTWMEERGRNSTSYGSHSDAYEVAARHLKTALDAALAPEQDK